MSIDPEILRLIVQGEVQVAGRELELRGDELVGPPSDLESALASVARQLDREVDLAAAPARGLVEPGRVDLSRLAAFIDSLSAKGPSGIDLAEEGLPGDDDSSIYGADEPLAGDDDSGFD